MSYRNMQTFAKTYTIQAANIVARFTEIAINNNNNEKFVWKLFLTFHTN